MIMKRGMKLGESTKLALRWIVGRPVETLLLVLAISLGIGATASGLALAWSTAERARETLGTVQYREIVVSVREEAADMELAAEKQVGTQSAVLTTEDLAAREDAEDVQYAYVANRLDLRLGSFQMPGGEAPVATAAEAGAAPDATSTDTTGEVIAAFEPPPQMREEPVLEGPEPVLEEIRGYEITPEFFTAQGLNVADGSLFTTGDMAAAEPILVLGSTLATTLFEDGLALGREVLSRGELFTIVGILAPTGTDYDTMGFAPALMAELQGLGGLIRGRPAFNTSLHFTVADSADLDDAKTQLGSWFDAKYGEGATVVTAPRDQAEATRNRTGRLVTVIVFLALTALVIAAANVTNILASRVMRKRRAVGVLKALGASGQGVFSLFLREALIIGLAGAAVGGGLSVLISGLMRETMGVGQITAGLVVLGILLAAALVTALNVLPALQASRTPASEAIRYE